MSNVWFTSDLHFGHKNIIKYCDRPFADSVTGVTEMNWAIVNNFNSLVQPDDLVYFLGDIAMGAIAESLKYVKHMNGKFKYLVPGNHDRCFKNPDKAKMYEDVGFQILPDSTYINFQGFFAGEICHFPFVGDEYDTRYKEERPVDNGQWLLHGHIHGKWRKNGRMIDVGIDAHGGFPVSLEEIKQLAESGEDFVGRKQWI